MAAFAGVASAAEIIPSLGLSRSVNDDASAKLYGGLALRGRLLPAVSSEIGVAYRSESRLDDRLTLRMWPVTASLWLNALPSVYAGAGVGWYHVSHDYDQDRLIFPIEDETRQEFGVHVGGGVRAPLAPNATLDLNGRYVMMREQTSRLVPGRFDPDFWVTSLGLAIRF